MSQTAYSVDPPIALPGLAGEKLDSITRANEDAASMGAGQAVVGGTDPETQGTLPSSAGEFFQGIALSEHGR